MNQRRSTAWVWILAIIVLLVIVAAVAYYFGTMHGQPVAVRPRFFVMRHPVLGDLGFWLVVLVVALIVGVIVATLWPSAHRTETFEEWHQREHAMRPPAPAPGSGPADAGTAAGKPDDGVPPG